MYRLFVAVDLPDAARLELAPLCGGLPGARWVPGEQLHLTLRFIGEVDGGRLRDIEAALSGIRAGSFTMGLKGLGHFPPRRDPRVLWVGVVPAEVVVPLRNKVEAALARCGIAPEGRKFSPHVTLARLKKTPLVKLTRYLAGNALFAGSPFAVRDFYLYASTLTAKGAIHQRLAAFSLGEPLEPGGGGSAGTG